ncbi:MULTISPECIES: sensor histidine kinase [Clostridium]|uniref:histidine kinase n=1 Tax=Clostridium brassicae TaxID=2999072 RepID=A0ABT4D938_9CLOT|nr:MULTISPECIES: HAMP domain-containing sensor histidine kinase [Clostridium]MCY6958817.1 HAMP domain-containing sensor histidine kinase [Clostridium brassicae]WMJ79642.1 HAMP domain-containing sensor histidine kinase [Clostridium sp. MB40-C1]
MRDKDVYKIEIKIMFVLICIVVLQEPTIEIIKFIEHSIQLRMGVNEPHSILSSNNFFQALLFFAYFHLIMHKKIRYFVNINKGLEKILQGDTNIIIPVYSSDELSKLAQNINSMVDKFKNSIIKERKAEQTKIDLITSISHDLRTPLTSILGYLQLIDNDEYKDEFVLRSYVNIVLNKTKRLKVLIDDLFEVTTLNNYGFKISKQRLDIVELINQLVIEHRVNFRKANIKCRLHFKDEKICILGDSMKLVRAFENLIFNCIKYSKTSEFMDILVDKEGDKAIIEFINYGEAICPLDIPYIFNKFYRVDKSRSEETGGSGLGLAITKNIIELHNGKIDVESNINKTIFKVILPC